MAWVKSQINGCFSKKRYSTEELAETVRLRCEKARGVLLRSYRCETCCGYHLTKLFFKVQFVTFNDRGQVTGRG